MSYELVVGNRVVRSIGCPGLINGNLRPFCGAEPQHSVRVDVDRETGKETRLVYGYATLCAACQQRERAESERQARIRRATESQEVGRAAAAKVGLVPLPAGPGDRWAPRLAPGKQGSRA